MPWFTNEYGETYRPPGYWPRISAAETLRRYEAETGRVPEGPGDVDPDVAAQFGYKGRRSRRGEQVVRRARAAGPSEGGVLRLAVGDTDHHPNEGNPHV